MKILFALSSFYPSHRAGTETYVLNLAKELIHLGYRVFVVIPAVGDFSKNYNYEGINVYSFSVPLKVSAAEMNGLVKLHGIEEFKKILQKIKPDVFHLHSLSRSMHAEHLKVAAEMGIKTVFTGHLGSTFCVNGDLLLYGNTQCNGHVKNQRCLSCFIKKKSNYSLANSKIISLFINNLILNNPLKRKFPAFNIVRHKLNQFKLLRKYSYQNIAIANWINEAYEINKLGNVTTVLQGIDGHFSSYEKKIKEQDKIDLIFVGRMHPDKGIHLLIKALEIISLQKFNLTIVTIPFKDEISYYNEIKEKYHQLGLSKWLEDLAKEQVADKLENSDILILPSTKNEAAPLVILEAFAKKVPVIGSDYIAIKEMVQHNVNGLIFKNGDWKSLKIQLERVINEPELISELSNNIGKVRTFKDVAQEHDELYRSL